MAQKLSAMNYIKNNKRRTAVLIVSLCLCFVLTYLTMFLLSTTEETFRPILLENSKKIQYISLASSSLGIDVDNLTIEEILPIREQKIKELAKKLETHEGITRVCYAQIFYELVSPAIGQLTYEIPLVETEDIPMILEHFNTKVIEGRMPQNPGELVFDRATMEHRDYVVGQYYDEEDCGDAFQIVGVLDSDSYFGCGVVSDEWEMGAMLMVLSEGIDDLRPNLEQEGIKVRENYDSVLDYREEKEFFDKEIVGVIDNSTNAIYVGIMILLSISVLIVYTMYLRERHDEWCLYCSIGYSRKTIYLSILRELLFTFVAAVVIGGVIIAVSELAFDWTMIRPRGLKCRYFNLQALGEILCSYVLIFGILQIPVRYALYKVRTIDAIEDDLY